MFALETIVENSLYAIRYDGIEEDEFENNEFDEDESKKDEFSRLFKNWSDPEYLDAFFDKHKLDLQKDFYSFISIEDAINRTIDESEALEQQLIEIAESGKTERLDTLQTLFKPLNKKDEELYPIPDYQKSKVYGEHRKSWLRIYAIRLNSNEFVVTGGGIKLTETMNDREHLKKELEKLHLVKQFLISKGIDEENISEFLEL